MPNTRLRATLARLLNPIAPGLAAAALGLEVLTLLALSMDWFLRFLPVRPYPPRMTCLSLAPEIYQSIVANDLATCVAYVAFTVGTWAVATRAYSPALRAMMWQLAAFVSCCGLAHLAAAIVSATAQYELMLVADTTRSVISLTAVLYGWINHLEIRSQLGRAISVVRELTAHKHSGPGATEDDLQAVDTFLALCNSMSPIDDDEPSERQRDARAAR